MWICDKLGQCTYPHADVLGGRDGVEEDGGFGEVRHGVELTSVTGRVEHLFYLPPPWIHTNVGHALLGLLNVLL